MLIDSLSEYAGAYNTVFLAGPQGQGPRPIEVAITPGKTGGWLLCSLACSPTHVQAS